MSADRPKMEHVFLFIGLFFGLLWVFLVPPFQTPDEPAHFFRAWSISEGKIVNKRFLGEEGKLIVGDYLPAEVAGLPDRMDTYRVHRRPDQKFEPGGFIELAGKNIGDGYDYGRGGRVFARITAGAYSPVPYLPQIAGILLGKTLRLSPLACFYIARLFTFFAYLALVFYAIRLLPAGKNILVLVALLPMTLGIAISVSSDVMLYGVSFLMVSLTLKLVLTDAGVPLSRREAALFYVLCAALSLMKPVYAGMAVLLFAVPGGKFKDRKARLVFICAGLLLAAVLLAGWNITGYDILTQKAQMAKGTEDAPGQMRFIMSHPLGFLKNVINGYIHYHIQTQGRGIVRQFIGVLGWLDLVFPAIMYNIVLLFIGVQLILTQSGPKIPLKTRLIMLAGFLIPVIGFTSFFYVRATPVGAPTLLGVQGRYFIPVAPLLLLSLCNTDLKGWDRPAFRLLSGAAVNGAAIFVTLSAATYYIALRYYTW